MEFLLSLFKCFISSTSEYSNLKEKELKTKVRECLKGNKYLTVLDDIWKTQVWDEIEDVFPDDKNGSRILITSRIEEVAFHCGTTTPHYLPFLNKEESWELFSKKVFQGEECPSDLEPLGRSIAESCGGLPLGVVVLAGIARRKKSLKNWESMMDIIWPLSEDKTNVMGILKLSYDNLPRRLKPCFLYFAIYPEDYEISARKLMQLWAAEGFIQPKETGNPNPPQVEDIAEYYLDELVDRSLVQVARRRKIDGGVKTCRIHDLLRELCISERKSNGFLEVSTEANMHTLSNPRRLSLHLHGRAESDLSFDKFNQSSTRSLYFFSEGRYQLDHVMKNFKLARVLYGEEIVFSSQFAGLKMMINLRYLKVSTYFRDIPASISSLRNLETLHLNRLFSIYIGIQSDLFTGMRRCIELSSLTNLRSIKLIGFDSLPLEFPSNVVKITLQVTPAPFYWKSIMNTLGRLTNLQILKLVHFDYIHELIFASGEFPRLREFQMREVDVKKWRLEKGAMPNIEYLHIYRCTYLYELPEELWSLTHLRQVRVDFPKKELENSLQNVELKNGCKLILSYSHN
ncbi:putative disease resistance RPP13-like protein 3 [Gastrolobium bilobum]|uniref:putative disease resistance RPP13-like protein 3 n=1 Tax=Gastrolobium bilobum TaxID=150636 RepID=UPI002AB1641F|nr:putative disease resistance RPP13-like protein 3 [Gastrolobium bilobum]